MENYPKYTTNFFKRLLFILMKQDLLTRKFILFEFQAMQVKNQFHIGELHYGLRWNKA